MKTILSFLINFILLVVARCLQIILAPILIIWAICRIKSLHEYSQWSLDLAASLDRLGNVLGKYAFNDLLGNGFGKPKETISSVLGKNLVGNSLKPVGKFVAKILNKFEKDHCVKSIDNNV